MSTYTCPIPAGTNVLVTGATGFTGTVLTRKLAAAGLRVSAIARASSRRSHLQGLGIRWTIGDVFDPRTVETAAEGAEYIFHMAAAFREAKSSEQDYRNVHVESTKLLSYKALEIENFKRLIHISTIGVHGHIEDPAANETYRFSPGDGYQRTKAEAELWLADFAAQQNLPYTIIRPAAIYGPGDRRLLKLFKMACRPIFPLLGSGRCMYHLIHVDDLTDAILLAATAPQAPGQAFIVGNEQPIPIAGIAAVVAATLGKSHRVLRLPIAPFFWAADVCEAVCRPLRIEPPIYRRRVAFYTKDRMFDTRKMRTVLGYTPRYGNREGIAETTRWYVDQGWLRT